MAKYSFSYLGKVIATIEASNEVDARTQFSLDVACCQTEEVVQFEDGTSFGFQRVAYPEVPEDRPTDQEPAPCPTEPAPPICAEPKRLTIRSRWRDLNSRGRGIEAYRLALLGDALVWLDKHPDVIVTSRGMVPKGIRASERRCEDECEVPEGMLVVTIKKNGTVHFEAGKVQESTDKPGRGAFYSDDRVNHIGCKRNGSAWVHIIEIDGVRHEFRSEG